MTACCMKTHKFGSEAPKNAANFLKNDEENGDDQQVKAASKELGGVSVTSGIKGRIQATNRMCMGIWM